MKIIVTAGGQGSKLWPYSRQAKPKQFQPIIGETTLFTYNIDTLLKAFSPEDIFVSTKRQFIKYVSDQAPKIPLKNYIIEPDIAKDRGPGEGLAFLRLSMLHPEEPFFIVQADCIHQPEDAFLKMITDAGKLMAKHKKYITGGIKATEPNLGVDYLQLGERIINGTDQEIYDIDTFLGRKDSYRETKELIENFHVVAHSNHSCWYPDMMLDAYKAYHPDWHKALMKIRDVLDKPGEGSAVEEIYATMKKGATEEVTSKVMESGKSMAILLPYRWTDVGTWGSVYEFFSDGINNYEDGQVISVDSKGSLVKTSSPHKLIAVAGVDDLVVVDTDDVLLVIPKDKISHIKDVQRLLEEKDHRQFL
jgi:mannose-1-phosphate guanylyltransferase